MLLPHAQAANYPDYSNAYNYAGLGHRMLHTTPESLAEQLPLHWSEPGLTITADARIDNRDELIAALGCGVAEAAGHGFADHSRCF